MVGHMLQFERLALEAQVDEAIADFAPDAWDDDAEYETFAIKSTMVASSAQAQRSSSSSTTPSAPSSFGASAKSKHGAFERQLVILRVQEPPDGVACQMLHVLALGYEQYRSVAPRASMARSLKLRPCKCRTGVDRSPAR